MAELAKGSHDIKLAHIELKRRKMEHKASEHALIIKKEMQQQELASKVVKVMGVMDDRGMLRREQNRGWGAKGVLNASGIRKYL